MRSVLLSCAIAFCLGTPLASATTIDFNSQAASAPSTFSSTTDSPLTIGLATFTGGELLRNETGSTDSSGVYATNAYSSGGFTNPLGISFSAPVSNFSVLITDNAGDVYTVSDNQGDSVTLTVAYNTSKLFTLGGTAITSVNISASHQSGYDFAIDDVSFGSGATSAPEPSSIALLGTGLLGIGAAVRRRLA